MGLKKFKVLNVSLDSISDLTLINCDSEGTSEHTHLYGNSLKPFCAVCIENKYAMTMCIVLGPNHR